MFKSKKKTAAQIEAERVMVRAESDWKQVTKDEFDAAIESYPANKLGRHVVQICEPPRISYLDWSRPSGGETGSASKYFDSEVAYISADWLGPNGELDDKDTRQFWRYHLLRRQ